MYAVRCTLLRLRDTAALHAAWSGWVDGRRNRVHEVMSYRMRCVCVCDLAVEGASIRERSVVANNADVSSFGCSCRYIVVRRKSA